MVWAIDNSNYVPVWNPTQEINPVVKYVRARRSGNHFIEIIWKQVCSNRVKGYKIYYCLGSRHNLTCNGSERSVTIDEPTATYGIVKNLTPYMYMLTITVMTEYGEGPRSNPVYS